MRLIAKKPCSFGGQKFYIGDEIPIEFVFEPKKQERLGVIAIASDNTGTPGEEPGNLYTQEQVLQIVEIIQLDAKKALAAVETVSDEGVLALLVSNDSRKTVREAAKNRLDKLTIE